MWEVGTEARRGEEMKEENEFEWNGKRYAATLRGRCNGCAFFDEDFNCDMLPSCESERRSDGKDVIFVEMSKAEEEGETR